MAKKKDKWEVISMWENAYFTGIVKRKDKLKKATRKKFWSKSRENLMSWLNKN